MGSGSVDATWFPHVPLALLLGLGGLWILNARFGDPSPIQLRSLKATALRDQVSLMSELAGFAN
jgi:hypothetical protein